MNATRTAITIEELETSLDKKVRIVSHYYADWGGKTKRRGPFSFDLIGKLSYENGAWKVSAEGGGIYFDHNRVADMFRGGRLSIEGGYELLIVIKAPGFIFSDWD